MIIVFFFCFILQTVHKYTERMNARLTNFVDNNDDRMFYILEKSNNFFFSLIESKVGTHQFRNADETSRMSVSGYSKYIYIYI